MSTEELIAENARLRLGLEVIAASSCGIPGHLVAHNCGASSVASSVLRGDTKPCMTCNSTRKVFRMLRIRFPEAPNHWLYFRPMAEFDCPDCSGGNVPDFVEPTQEDYEIHGEKLNTLPKFL